MICGYRRCAFRVVLFLSWQLLVVFLVNGAVSYSFSGHVSRSHDLMNAVRETVKITRCV